jgi:hypothetical protein
MNGEKYTSSRKEDGSFIGMVESELIEDEWGEVYK